MGNKTCLTERTWTWRPHSQDCALYELRTFACLELQVPVNPSSVLQMINDQHTQELSKHIQMTRLTITAEKTIKTLIQSTYSTLQ